MTYEIYTDNATELIQAIFSSCKNGKDPNGMDIKTWGVTTTKDGTKVLIHTTDQWEDKCNVHIDPSPENDVVIVTARYWKKYDEDQRTGTEFDYMLGRFTELVLVHFKESVFSVDITI